MSTGTDFRVCSREPHLRPFNLQRGQASMEYAVICSALAIALGIGMVDDTSVLRELIEALKVAYQRFSFAISLPT